MKAIKTNEVIKEKPSRKFYFLDREIIIRAEVEKGEQKERFDKNSLSENDLDTIQAII